MGSGKTTVGRQLAKKLNLQFIDMDSYIENRYHKSISAIFEEKGEAGFREIERKALHEIVDFEHVVISTGGGMPCFFDNMAVMNQTGVTIYLEASVDELAERLMKGKQQRPLIEGKTPEEITEFIATSLAGREAFYLQAALILDSNGFFADGDYLNRVERLIDGLPL
jgi:shikimate kinase